MPPVIWATSDRGFEGTAGTWLDESDGPDMRPYILETEAALLASPAVQALIAAAKAEGMEMAANIALLHDTSIVAISSADMRARQIAPELRAAAATLRTEGTKP